MSIPTRTPLTGAARGLALAALLLPALAGCSNNPYPPGQSAQSVIYRYLPGDLRTLDPTKSYTADEALVVDAVYASYYQYHPFKTAPYELELALGAVEPTREPFPVTVTENGRPMRRMGERWTFRLKEGLRFQDDPCFPGGKGREATAHDIMFAFRRMADPRASSPVLSFFEDKVLGLEAYVANSRAGMEKSEPHDFEAPVEGLQLDPEDPYTFRIVLNQPYPQLRYLMAMHFTSPQAHEAYEKYGEELARHPVGVGTYVIEEYTPKRRLVLTANPNRPPQFYPAEGQPGDAEAGLLKDAGKPLPLADKVIFNFIREPITSWNFFLQGYLDRYGVTQDNFSQVIDQSGGLSPEMKQKGVELFKSATPNIYYFCFNMRDPVVGGYTPQARALRQAISLAIDSEEFIDLFFQGRGQNPQFLIPPGIYGHEPGYKNPYKGRDLARAKRLLAQAGYPNGIDAKTGDRFTLYYDNTAATASGRQFNGILKKQIEQLGIRFESREWRDVVWQDRVDKGQFQFIRYGWLADYPDPENFVFLLYGPNRGPGPNHAFYENAEYDRLFEQMRAMDDTPERMAIIRRMREIAVEDCPWVYLTHDEALGLTFDWITNVKPHGIANDGMKYWAVDGPKRAARQAEWNNPNYWPAILLVVVVLAGSIPAANVVRQRRRRRVRVASDEAGDN